LDRDTVKGPSEEELAAIAVALATIRKSAAQSTAMDDRERRVEPWTLATRLPELEFDELLALRHACSIRY
jgi:hypothetical protein